MMPFKFKLPKNGHFFHYCGDCSKYEFMRQIGCAYEGMCYAIEDIPTTADAYDKPCELWTSRKLLEKRTENDKR